LQTTD